PYAIHQELLKAFDSEEPGSGRDRSGRLLWRLEPENRHDSHATLLVQSFQVGRWSESILPLAREPQDKEFCVQTQPGQILRFRIRANPIQSEANSSKGPEGKRPRGKRIALV